MNGITTINNDIEYYLAQKQSELDTMVAGMVALINDSDSKYEAMKNQNWFQRMILTVTGKNKATVEEIRRNNDRLQAYCVKVIAAVIERQRISEGIIINLGAQINMIYASHMELKQSLYGIATKLNEKIESVDNFHLLVEEINLGRFGKCYTDIYRVLALFDKRMVTEPRKMDIIAGLLREKNILNDRSISVEKYLCGVCDTLDDFTGTVYMETLSHHGSKISLLTSAVLENWNLVPIANRQFMKKQSGFRSFLENWSLIPVGIRQRMKKRNVVRDVLEKFAIDGNIKFSFAVEYEQAVENKRVILEAAIESGENNKIESDKDKAANILPHKMLTREEAKKLGAAGHIVIPHGYTEIGKKAFYKCKKLTGIEIPNSVTTVGEYAFYGCVSLKNVEIPYSVTIIGAYAFSWCNNLTSVNIPDSVTTIGNYAFSGCRNLTSVQIPASVVSIGKDTFAWCDKLTVFCPKDSYAYKYFEKNKKIKVMAN